MAVKFSFSARASDGKVVRGTVMAKSELDVKAKLKFSNYEPLSIKKLHGKSEASFDLFKKRITNKEFKLFLRQLSILLKSGVPLLESLNSLKESFLSTGLGDVLNSITQDIEEGNSFSDALKKHDKVFNKMVVNLVKAGEQGGILDDVLDRLSTFFEKRAKLQSKVKSALMYPVVTIMVAVGALTAILVFVIPKFKSMFDNQGQDLPAMTKFVVSMSELFINNWYLVLFSIVGVPAILIFLYKGGIIRSVADELMLKIPLFGSLIRKGVVARMSRTLSTLLKSGIRINDALDITIGTMGNLKADKLIKKVKEDIIEGQLFSDSLKKTRFFPQIVVQMTLIGEKTGNLDSMLEKVADFYEEEVENSAEQLTSLLEPLVIVFLGGLIGFLVIAMFLPIFKLGDMVG